MKRLSGLEAWIWFGVGTRFGAIVALTVAAEALQSLR